MNVSRSRIMPIMTEYFVDQEKYFYFILLWTNVSICVQLIVTLAIGTAFLIFIQHICGMFKIARYKNKNINRKSNIQNVYSRFINEFKNVYNEYMLLYMCISNRFNIFMIMRYLCYSYRLEYSLDMDTL
jgi:hypothetical protein